MRSSRATRPFTIGIVVGCLVATSACGSDGGSDDSFGSGPAPTVGDTVAATTAETTEPATESPTEPPAGAETTAPTSTTVPAPLVEPAVSLLDIGTFDQPVEVTHRPGDSPIYVVEQPGRVLAVTDEATDVVLDITDRTSANGEQGLLGLAFHPTADLAYVDYIDGSGDTVVAEFAVDPPTGQFDPASFREVLTVDQPYTNHNGGQLAFGPDQLLYIGLGDGGSGGDPQRFALEPRARVSARSCASTRSPSAISRSRYRPTTRSSPRPAPTRRSGRTDCATRGGSRSIRPRAISGSPTSARATSRRSTTRPRRIASMPARESTTAGVRSKGYERFNDDQSADGAVAPLFVYDHSDGRCSVSGGVVARDTTVADLAGWYVFGDYCTGQIWALDPTAPAATPRTVQIARLDGLAAIAEGPDRELYAVSNAGTVARIVPLTP